MKGQLFAIIAVGLAALGVLVAHYYRPSRRAERSDLGLEVFAEDCTMVDDEDPPTVEFDHHGIELAYYGSTQVHKHCLNARRDGLTACSDCARVLGAVAS